MKYALIREQAAPRRVARWCEVLGVSRSGYYAWLSHQPSARQVADDRLLVQIRRVHLTSRRAYGAVKTWQALRVQGVACGKHRVARLRRRDGIEADRRRRFKATTKGRSASWAAPDLVRRAFTAPALDRVWVGDVTFIWTAAGWLYLAVLIDLCSRRVVGWGMSARNNLALVMQALTMALYRRRPPAGLIHHTDRGQLYVSHAYLQLQREHHVLTSMGRRGDCFDNACAETFFSTLKNELVHGLHFRDREHARSEIVSYIEGFYNRQRLHQALDYVSPESFERRLLCS